MAAHDPKYPRILAIAASKYGFGYAVLKDVNLLSDWGVKWTKKGNKNKVCLAKVKSLIKHHEPHILALENALAKCSRRSARIRDLTKRMTNLAKEHNLRFASFSRKKMKQVFVPEGKGTRHDVARAAAERFSDDVGYLLPRKREAWMVEHPRLAMFDAMAIALLAAISARDSQKSRKRSIN